MNITCYRGRHRYLPTVPGLRAPPTGRVASSSTASSSRTGRERRSPSAAAAAGSVDAYASAVGRWLVTRDGFDFLAYYLSGYDFASHGPARTARPPSGALEQADAAIGALLDAAGGPDEFLERYAVVLLSDHGQTPVEQARAWRSSSRISRARSS